MPEYLQLVFLRTPYDDAICYLSITAPMCHGFGVQGFGGLESRMVVERSKTRFKCFYNCM